MRLRDRHRLGLAQMYFRAGTSLGHRVPPRLVAAACSSRAECEALCRFWPGHSLDQRTLTPAPMPLFRAALTLQQGGKYGSGILYYLFYFLWRAEGWSCSPSPELRKLTRYVSGGSRGPIFVLWCIFGTNYSLYAGAWVRVCGSALLLILLTAY